MVVLTIHDPTPSCASLLRILPKIKNLSPLFLGNSQFPLRLPGKNWSVGATPPRSMEAALLNLNRRFTGVAKGV
jgi:hypothetical protein